MSNQTWNEQNLSFAYAYPDFDSTYEYQTIAANGTTYEDATGSFSFSVSQVSSNVEQIEISNFTDAYGNYFPAASFNGPVFFGPAGDAPIIGATLVITNMAGLTQSDIAYSSTSVGVNWENLNDYTNTFITIDVTFGSALPPTLTSVTPAVIEQGQATVIATVTPGGPGDTLSLTQTGGSGTLSLVTVNGIQEIVYQAPAQVTSDEVDTVSFTVYDEQLTTLVSGTASVQLDADMTKVYLQGYFNTVSAPATAPTGTTTTGAPITGPIFGNAIINGTSASQTITAYGYNNTINADGGNDVIYAGLGQATVTVSNGNGNNTISGALGNSSVTLGNGNNTVTGPQGNTQMTVGNGSNVTTLGGYFNVVHAGSTTGTDYISAGIGNATVTGSNGNFVVLAGGYSDVVTLGNGNDDVFTSPAGSNPSVPTGSTAPAEQGLAVVTTGSGNDTIMLGGYDNTVNVGSGMNFIGGALGLNTFVLASSGFDEIAGFSTTNGDTLNVAAALQAAGWNLAPATLGNYLKVADANNNAIISVVKGGSGAGSAIAQLDGVGNLTLAGLQNHLIL